MDDDNIALPSLPRQFRARTKAFIGNRNEVNSTRTETREQPLSADGAPIRYLRDSYCFDSDTGEWCFRARKSSTASTGSNRRSTGEEYVLADDLRARKASLVKVNTVEEEAASALPELTDTKAISGSEQPNNTLKDTGGLEVGKVRKESESSSIEEVSCIPVDDPSVFVEYPFRKLPREFDMELPCSLSVPISNEIAKERPIEVKESTKETACDRNLGGRSPHINPIPIEQHHCTTKFVCNRLPSLIPMDERNNFDPSPPPCLCTVHITNASKLLLPGAVHTYKTDSILVPKSSRSKFGYKIKLLIQVSCDYLSLAIVLTEGDPSRRLPWPFNKTVLFGLENIDRSLNCERGFKCYGNGEKFKECLGRPQSAENTPIGIRHFIPVQALRNGFINDNNTLVVHCLIFSFGLNLETQVSQLSSVPFLNRKCLISAPTIHVS